MTKQLYELLSELIGDCSHNGCGNSGSYRKQLLLAQNGKLFSTDKEVVTEIVEKGESHPNSLQQYKWEIQTIRSGTGDLEGLIFCQEY